MNLHKINDEVFIAQDPIVHFGDEEVAFVKHQAQSSPRRRARIWHIGRTTMRCTRC